MSGETKICTRCGGDPKPLDQFHVKHKARDGRQKWCKQCISDYGKDRTKAKREAAEAVSPTP